MRTEYHVIAEVKSISGHTHKTEFYLMLNDNDNPRTKARKAANAKYPFGTCESVTVTPTQQ